MFAFAHFIVFAFGSGAQDAFAVYSMDLIITLTLYSCLLLLDAAPAMGTNYKRILQVFGLLNVLRVLISYVFMSEYAMPYVITFRGSKIDVKNIALSALFDYGIFLCKYTYTIIFYPDYFTILKVLVRVSGNPRGTAAEQKQVTDDDEAKDTNDGADAHRW